MLALLVVSTVAIDGLSRATTVSATGTAPAASAGDMPPSPAIVKSPTPAKRHSPSAGSDQGDTSVAEARRRKLMNGVRSWGAQMQELDIRQAAAAPVDLLVVDASSGIAGGKSFTKDDVEALKQKPDGGRRLAISYLSIGESEDYRPDYFTSEYMTEDAPDWLLHENKNWKGNRLIGFCKEGWQRTILGDEDGRNVYNSVEPSPLYKLIELGFDGAYLDRVDVYSEVQKECPDAANKMVDFVARLAAHARKKNPNFIVILQNAEELLENRKMVANIDAVAKEDWLSGAAHDQRTNDPTMVKEVLAHLSIAKAAGRPVLILDYLNDARRRAAEKARIESEGFIPAFGPRKLDQLWLPGTHF